MRGSKTAVVAGLVVTAATATILKAQQMLGGPAPGAPGAKPAAVAPVDPDLTQRSARQLLNNGLSYLKDYQDYDRALKFLREAAIRPAGLSERERKQLTDALARAEQGKADEADTAVASDETTPETARPRKAVGSAWARSRRPVRDRQLAAATADSGSETLAVHKTSAETVDPTEPPAMDLPPLPQTETQVSDAPPALAPGSPATTQDVAKSEPVKAAAAPKTASEPIFLTGSSPVDATPKAPEQAPADAPPPIADTKSRQVDGPKLPAPADTPPPSTDPTPAPLPVDSPTASTLPAPEPPPVELPDTKSPATNGLPAPVVDAAKATAAPKPTAETVRPALPASPALPLEDAPAANPEPVTPPTDQPPAVQARVAVPVASKPVAAPVPESNAVDPPVADAEELPPLPAAAARTANTKPAAAMTSPLDTIRSIGSTLSPETLREVEEVARLQDDANRRNPPLPLGVPSPNDGMSPDDLGATSRLVLPRAPSPTEPRPIRVIPVPEEFVPLPKREWEPSRKYWAAAATCHMPLYFQDAVLERYGQSVEQAAGPMGRFLSYPLDDPRQSNQRNNLIQPMYSAGMFITQLALLPYNMLMDPPWEAEYDLGYYRPGDKIPSDTYYLPKTGIGPFLRGNRY